MIHVINIYGIVQGVGFRPTVARHASEYNIKGTVSNKGPYVEVIAEGEYDALKDFEDAIRERSPKRAVILKMDVKEIAKSDESFSDFKIIESERKKGEIFISPDIAICEDCKRELFEKGNRRYLHPFINCTCCGPRLTILDKLPYDRERTSMKEFEMCPDCAREYTTESDRRFDAQPVCCNNCGPEVFLLDMKGRKPSEIRGREAITKARRAVSDGKIIAVKGIGGYHLCCDATNEEAVSLLRERKKRPAKPLAVMMRDLEATEKYCEVTESEREVLDGHQKPIILLRRKKDASLAKSIAPGNLNVGVMLPYAPLHLLLFDYEDDVKMPDALVMTSANTSGAPIVRDEEGAFDELSHLCDEILAHNRKIRIRADDTVMEFYEDKPYMIRRSRGYAPLPVMVDMKEELPKVVLGIGGELKNTFCIRVNNLCYESPYIGDMEDVRTVEALRETIKRFEELLEVKPEAVICDLHPRYNTTAVAEELGIKTYKIQHHYAHVLSCMAENNMDGRVIGVSFDGTGYGTDGTIWGGEILLCDREGFERKVHIKPFKQIGGDVSAKEGWRIAVAMMYGVMKHNAGAFADKATIDIATRLKLCGVKETLAQIKMYDMNMNAVESTSVGRLFDAVSAILGLKREQSFEGEAASALQTAALKYVSDLEQEGYTERELKAIMEADALSIIEKFKKVRQRAEQDLILPTDILVCDIADRALEGDDPGELAYFFHAALAYMIADACEFVKRESGENRVVLTGGCFQNTLLLKLAENELKRRGFEVAKHGLIPPNDGGIALGQAIWSGFDKGYIGGDKSCV
ncbi:MAG: carbamoyltransferase HypF [Lachnospiraceae bacterium]|nr:carbamoyltransferase HypF [Lachnospiraceae bacterium]